MNKIEYESKLSAFALLIANLTTNKVLHMHVNKGNACAEFTMRQDRMIVLLELAEGIMVQKYSI